VRGPPVGELIGVRASAAVRLTARSAPGLALTARFKGGENDGRCRPRDRRAASVLLAFGRPGSVRRGPVARPSASRSVWKTGVVALYTPDTGAVGIRSTFARRRARAPSGREDMDFVA
jgi:hypothetical protein